MSRYDLTDFEWRVIEPLLPNKPRACRVSMIAACSTASSGGLRSGAPRRDLPERRLRGLAVSQGQLPQG